MTTRRNAAGSAHEALAHHRWLRTGPVVGLAAVVLAVLVAQVALAGDSSDETRIASLERQVDQLKSQFATARAAKKKSKRGPRGSQGPPGPQGPAGAAGQNLTETVVVRSSTVGNGQRTATCNAGERVISGGAAAAADPLILNGPNVNSGTPTAWTALTVSGMTVQAFALCARP